MAIEDRLLALENKLTKLREEASQAQGACKQILARLKSEFGCGTLEQAEEKLREVEEEVEAKQAELNKAIRRLQEQYPELEV